MSDLDDVINAVHREESVTVKSKHKSQSVDRTGLRLLVSFVALAFLVFQVYTLTIWMVGVPEDTVQADITTLLKSTDDRLQEYGSAAYPDTLPPDTPRWLLGYKKTLAGYRISAEIDGVLVELHREDDQVSVRRIPKQ